MESSNPETTAAPSAQATTPRWQPVSAQDRRVLGVLIEKAKTTPDAYPMSISAITSGANQKSNRFPAMNLEPDDVQESLDRLRQLGALGEVQGSGRVPRFRHYLYDWFGVDKVELAVMAELLLRGSQTEGELRGRAARMEPIADLAALRPVLQSLKEKKLVIPLTPEGRGHVLTHALYEPREMERVRANVSSETPELGTETTDAVVSPQALPPAAAQKLSRPAPAAAPPQAYADLQALHSEVSGLRMEVAQLRQELDELRSQVEAGGTWAG